MNIKAGGTHNYHRAIKKCAWFYAGEVTGIGVSNPAQGITGRRYIYSWAIL